MGRVIDIEAKEIAGHKLDLFVISFEQERMMLRVPVAKAKISGLRKLSSRKIMENALVTLKGRSRVSRAMWNRRAQEYEAKINSGDPVSIAEVVRDLHRNAGQPDQSYSERQIYEAALDRLARELAAVERIDKDLATQKLNSVLQKVALSLSGPNFRERAAGSNRPLFSCSPSPDGGEEIKARPIFTWSRWASSAASSTPFRASSRSSLKSG